MADKYVRSTDGNNADDGSTWALAEADLHTPTWVAGDRIFVSQVHAQSTAGTITIALAGTVASPTQLLCANDAAEPPTALATTGTVATTGATSITVTGSAYIYGLTITAGSGVSNSNLFLAAAADNVQTFEQCVLESGSTGSSGFTVTFGVGSSTRGAEAILIDTDIKLNHVNSYISVVNGILRWKGGALLGSAISQKIISFGSTGRGGNAEIDGVDLSNAAATVDLVAAGTGVFRAVFRNCKLPASWSGDLCTTFYPGVQVEMYNCDSGDTNYRLWIENNAGSVKHETTIVRTGGASDGTTAQAWKITTGADAEYPAVVIRTPEIVAWNDTTGSSVTATVEIVHDSQGAGSGSKFQDDEIWLEVMYLGTSGVPLGSWIRDCKADVLAAAANQADSTETWTTTGLTTPVKQKLSVTFTAQEKGFVHARVVMAKASKTCYVCPKMTVA